MSIKRLIKELTTLSVQQSGKELLDNDYIVYFDDSNLFEVYALIKPPYESVYRHKFIKLHMKIPENYPHSPPEVYFVNHDGVRIHPNMYENGKCCSTILNTWGDNIFEKWTSSMGIETILLTFHSFLDNNPYTYEPGGRDDPSYTVYVQYQTWTTCLIRYLQYEDIPLFKQYIHNYLLTNIDEVFNDLEKLCEEYPYDVYNTRCFEIDDYYINYERICDTMRNYYSFIEYKESMVLDGESITANFEEFLERNYSCNICFDTCLDQDNTVISKTKLECNHEFHTNCLKHHIESNQAICPMCRRSISTYVLESLADKNEDNVVQNDEWVVNPTTKRRVKVGSRTYKYLKEQGIL